MQNVLVFDTTRLYNLPKQALEPITRRALPALQSHLNERYVFLQSSVMVSHVWLPITHSLLSVDANIPKLIARVHLLTEAIMLGCRCAPCNH